MYTRQFIPLHSNKGSITIDVNGDDNIDNDPLRNLATHVAQLQSILSNQVKETQYLRRMIENFHFNDKPGMRIKNKI